MKKTLVLSLLSLAIIGTMPSCKKGENDPFLSLRTRKARMAGEWKLSASESKHTTNSANSSNTNTSTYDGSTETSVYTSTIGGSTTSTSSTLNYTIDLDIEKNGTYEMTQVEDGVTYTIKGTWIFLKRSKEDELKNKEAIILTETSSTDSEGYNGTVHDLSGSVFVIDQLKNKEMIWTSDYAHSEGGETETDHYKLTFTPK